MNHPPWKAALWLVGYAALVVAPLVVAYSGSIPAARSFWIEFGVGLGFVGLSMMALQFVLTGRFRHVAASLGLDSMLHFHRQIGIAGALLVLAHPVILIAANPRLVVFFDPRANLPRAAALVTVVIALILLIITTLWRQRFRLAYEWWRLGHGVLAFLVVMIGLAHVLQVGHYVSPLWKQVVWVALTGGALALLLHARVVKPLRMRKRPYRVVDVEYEGGNSYTLTVEPEGHGGMQFEPGQFAWVTFGPTPFSLQQHPFSFSASAEEKGLGFTIKELGDFTSRIGEIEPGSLAFLEGPYGAFTPSDDEGREVVFIVGGVGVTPVVSMLRTFRDRGERRRIWMINCNVSEETTLFREELHDLAIELEMELIMVYEEPPATGSFETGRLSTDILERHLPPPDPQRQHFVCGPDPLMDLAETHLRKSGVPMRAILSERFKIV